MVIFTSFTSFSPPSFVLTSLYLNLETHGCTSAFTTQSWEALYYTHQGKLESRTGLGYSEAGLFYQEQQLGQELVRRGPDRLLSAGCFAELGLLLLLVF